MSLCFVRRGPTVPIEGVDGGIGMAGELGGARG